MKMQRLQEIEDYILTQGNVSLDELCEHFQVSKNTIRRDINEIIEKGTIKKIYGGVMAIEDPTLLPYEHREVANSEDKQNICRFAASLIESGSIIFIDSGTTTSHILDYLSDDVSITVITNNIDIINAAMLNQKISLITLGNLLKRKTRSLVNVANWEYYSKINIDMAFMAATGISINRGITNSDLREYEIKSHIVNQADKSILLVDSTKFDHTALVTYASIDDFQHIITSPYAPKQYREYCKNHGILLTENP